MAEITTRWDLPRAVPIDQWFRELNDTPPPGSNIQRANFTADRQDLCIVAAAEVDNIGSLLEGPMNKAARLKLADQLQVIGQCMTALLCQPHGYSRTTQQRERLAEAGIHGGY